MNLALTVAFFNSLVVGFVAAAEVDIDPSRHFQVCENAGDLVIALINSLAHTGHVRSDLREVPI